MSIFSHKTSRPHKTYGIGFLLLLGTIALAQLPSEPWAVPDAPYRCAVTLKKAPASPEFGVEIDLADYGLTRPDLCDLLLLSPNGTPVAIAKAGYRIGDRLLLLAQDLKPNLRYLLYFGGNKTRTSPTWNPKRSLLMETKPAPGDLGFDSLQDLKSAWTRSTENPGANFVSTIYHGGNLFGPSSLFLTRYTGYLKIPEARDITFYTLSSDCSFVVINDQPEFGWPGRHSPNANLESVPKKKIHCPAGLLKIEYYAAKGEVPAGAPLVAAMVLGWDREGRMENIPESAWMHPGTTEVRPIQSITGTWLPTPKIKVDSFVAYGNQWFYEIAFTLHHKRMNEVSWEFADGAVLNAISGTRLLTGAESQLVKLKIHCKDSITEQVTRIDVPERLQRTSINDPTSVRRLIKMLLAESGLQLSADSYRNRLSFVCDFGTDQELARFVGPKPNLNPADQFQLKAELARLRLASQADPQQARTELSALLQILPQNLRNQCAKEMATTEMDLAVFGLRDASALGRLRQIAFLNFEVDLAMIAKVRIGDLYRLLGQYKEAIAQYMSCNEEKKNPAAKDAANSIAVRSFLDQGNLQDAVSKLEAWELHHPMAKFDSDFLLLHARALLELGRWQHAQAELDSFHAIQPDSPYLIDLQFYQARILFEKGDKEKARQLWNELATKYPKHPLATEAKLWAAKP